MDKKTIDKLFQGQITIKNIPLTEKFVQLKTDRSPYDVKVLNLLKPNDDALYSYCKYKEISVKFA